MPRFPSRLTLIALALAAQSGLAMAQQSAAQPTPSQAPPKLQNVEPGSDIPATNIPPKRGTQIEERRSDSGEVTQVDVTAGGSHYTMKPNNPPGNAVPGSVTGNQVRGVQWTVGTFDLSGKRHATSDTGQNVPTADAPPPPPLPANASDKQ
ncbi:MAG TPA: hypothetical protein VF793_20795 [Telluria sp.]